MNSEKAYYDDKDDDSKVVLNRSRLSNTLNSCIWTAKWSTKHDYEPCCKSTCFLLICHQAIFSITDPNQEVYLVVRIEKVLQGSISSCIEPYLKSGDTKKAAQKAHKWAEICCKSLGQYGMPFGWTARWGDFRLMLGIMFFLEYALKTFAILSSYYFCAVYTVWMDSEVRTLAHRVFP